MNKQTDKIKLPAAPKPVPASPVPTVSTEATADAMIEKLAQAGVVFNPIYNIERLVDYCRYPLDLTPEEIVLEMTTANLIWREGHAI